MGGSRLIDALLFGLAAFLSAYAALTIVRRRSLAPRPSGTMRLLFSNGDLVDADPEAAALIAAAPEAENAESRLRAALSGSFELVDRAFGAETATRQLSRDGKAELSVEGPEAARRVTLRRLGDGPESTEEVLRQRALESELEVLRANTRIARYPVWRQTPDGTITWINSAYLSLAEVIFGATRARTWPLPSIFGDVSSVPLSEDAAPERMLLAREAPDATPRWFDCVATDVGPERVYTAHEVTHTVEAEAKLRDFMQTLTKTFAQLPTGLAIFDRQRRLVLFNPALADLTELPPDMLIARPVLADFLDALRERRMMPEPRDYAAWRRSIADLEARAEEGSYEDKWHLEDGRIYRVSGRPHPDGAIALILDDVTADVTLTRQFRAELDLGQAVLDGLDAAVAVFAPSGVMTMTNVAYGTLWGTRPDLDLSETSIAQATQMWSEKTAPSPVWGDLRDYVVDDGPREEWLAELRLSDGRALACRFKPLADGSTLATFEPKGAQLLEPEEFQQRIANTGF